MRDFSLRGKQDGISSVFNNVIAQLRYVTWQYLHESIRCAFHRAADCTKEKRSICITPRHPFDAMHRENVALYLIHDAYSPACTVGCWFSKEKGGRREEREREAQNSTTAIQRLLYSAALCLPPLRRKDTPCVDHRAASSDGRNSASRRSQHANELQI